jgi:hypothetical protein
VLKFVTTSEARVLREGRPPDIENQGWVEWPGTPWRHRAPSVREAACNPWLGAPRLLEPRDNSPFVLMAASHGWLTLLVDDFVNAAVAAMLVNCARATCRSLSPLAGRGLG